MSKSPWDLSEKEISELLAQAREQPHQYSYPEELLGETAKPAAVLIPFLRDDSEWHILFTRRTDTLPEHSGQVAFPGGRADPGDNSPEATALREAYEEIALRAEDVKILGKLKKIPTITNYWVTPVIGKIPWPYSFTLAQEEVSRVFTIPLSWLANATHFEIRQREISDYFAPLAVIYFNTYDGEVLWGVSAQITLNLLQALRLY